MAAANGGGTYTWNTTGVAPGTYYIAGYMYDGSHLHLLAPDQAITITGSSGSNSTKSLP